LTEKEERLIETLCVFRYSTTMIICLSRKTQGSCCSLGKGRQGTSQGLRLPAEKWRSQSGLWQITFRISRPLDLIQGTS